MDDQPLIDAHVHLVDFLQDSAGVERLLERMDAAGVERAVVFGLPYRKRWPSTEPARPTYYLDDEAQVYPWVATDARVREMVERVEGRERLVVTVNGVDPTGLDAADRVDELLGTGVFAGVGELLLRHGRLSAHVATEAARADHPGVRRIVDVCVRHGVPLAVHQNAGSTGQGPTAFVSEMETLLGWWDVSRWRRRPAWRGTTPGGCGSSRAEPASPGGSAHHEPELPPPPPPPTPPPNPPPNPPPPDEGGGV